MGRFGDCCDDMGEALKERDSSNFLVSEVGVLYLTIGLMDLGSGQKGYFDMAVKFCPFCGTELQTPEQIARTGQVN